MSGAAQIRGRSGKRPPIALDTRAFADLLKLAIAQVMKQELSAAVFGVLKTLRHHARGIQMPQIQLFGVVPANEEVEQSIAVIVKPDGAIGIDPGRQTGSIAYPGKTTATVVMKKLRLSPLDEK